MPAAGGARTVIEDDFEVTLDDAENVAPAPVATTAAPAGASASPPPPAASAPTPPSVLPVAADLPARGWRKIFSRGPGRARPEGEPVHVDWLASGAHFDRARFAAMTSALADGMLGAAKK